MTHGLGQSVCVMQADLDKRAQAAYANVPQKRPCMLRQLHILMIGSWPTHIDVPQHGPGMSVGGGISCRVGASPSSGWRSSSSFGIVARGSPAPAACTGCTVLRQTGHRRVSCGDHNNPARGPADQLHPGRFDCRPVQQRPPDLRHAARSLMESGATAAGARLLLSRLAGGLLYGNPLLLQMSGSCAHPSMERGGLGPEAAIDARTDSSSTQ